MQAPISSSKNALIKKCIGLEKKRNRNESSLFLIEGIRETSLAEQNGWEIEEVLYPEGILSPDALQNHPEYPIHHQNPQAVDSHVFDKIAYRKGIANVVSIAKQKEVKLDSINLGSTPLLLVLQSLEKPGNIGAILRTADAAGLKTVVLVEALADKYNPNLIRSSLGAAFCLDLIETSSEELHNFCRKNNIPLYSTYLEGAVAHYDTDFRSGGAIIMGSEANGIDEFWKENSDAFVKIPMYGNVDSMNVSTSCAVVLFEAVRQQSLNN
jgi:RNA methyltransferase, TrmH family